MTSARHSGDPSTAGRPLRATRRGSLASTEHPPEVAASGWLAKRAAHRDARRRPRSDLPGTATRAGDPSIAPLRLERARRLRRVFWQRTEPGSGRSRSRFAPVRLRRLRWKLPGPGRLPRPRPEAAPPRDDYGRRRVRTRRCPSTASRQPAIRGAFTSTGASPRSPASAPAADTKLNPGRRGGKTKMPFAVDRERFDRRAPGSGSVPLKPGLRPWRPRRSRSP